MNENDVDHFMLRIANGEKITPIEQREFTFLGYTTYERREHMEIRGFDYDEPHNLDECPSFFKPLKLIRIPKEED